MDREDVYRVIDQLWIQNEDEVTNWIRDKARTRKALRRADKEISALEKAEVLR